MAVISSPVPPTPLPDELYLQDGVSPVARVLGEAPVWV